jgi:anion-transporting  ArsA/GET3 family ATPase
MGAGSQRVVIVSGKGGVGKSSVSAALALGMSQKGLRTLVCEVNAKERVSVLLDRPLAGPQVTALEDNLWSVNVQPQDAMREYALMIVKFNTIYNAVFENRVVRYFLKFVPSLQELVLLGKILYHVQEKESDTQFRFDRVIVDAPATGHAVSFLRIPRVLLSTVPPGPLAAEAQKMNDILADADRTKAVLVTIPEEMPLVETAELHQALIEGPGIRTEGIVLNSFVGPRFSAIDLKAVSIHPGIGQVVEQHMKRAQASSAARDRLSSLERSVWLVPRFYGVGANRSLVTRMAEKLAPVINTL